MYDLYNDNKFTRQMYSTAKQLMKLAEMDDCDGFLALAQKSKALFDTNGYLFEVTVTVGLMARNKADILDKFIEKILPDKACLCSDIIYQLAGALIRKHQCREAVKLFILKLPEKPTTYYILISAIMTDDLEFFKLLYDFKAYYGISLLFGGIFKSRKILDHITDYGSDLLKNNMPCEVDFNEFIVNKKKYLLEAEPKDDILIKWMKNIHSMYLNNEVSEKSCKILRQIANNTNINTDLNAIFPSLNNADYYTILMRKIFILNICEQKANDLTNFIPPLDTLCLITPDTDDVRLILNNIINAIVKIAGDTPFVTYCEKSYKIEVGFIIKIAERLDNTLTVRLINGFDMHGIYLLLDNVRLEIDAEDPETAENLRNILVPDILTEAYVQDVVMHFIDNGLITVEKMAELAALAQNYDVVNMLFDHKNK